MSTPIIQGIPDLGPGLRLHLNEHTGGCSPAVLAAVRALDATALSTYPDYTPVVLETAAHFGVEPERLILTNGLDEGIFVAAMTYLAPATPAPLVARGAPARLDGPPEIVIALPAFEAYASTATPVGATVVAIPPRPDFSFPADEVVAAVTPRTRIIYINSPHNPSGVPVPNAVIRRVAEAAPHALVFVDEAYHDFSGQHFLGEAARHPNVVIGRTFSKAYGLAGVRIGALIGSAEVIGTMRALLPVFTLNVCAVAALRAALRDTAYLTQSIADATVSKARLCTVLDRLGLPYWPSAANFVLVRVGDGAQALLEGLRARGIFVRDRSKDPGCAGCLRITTVVPEHTERAIAALEALCAAR